MQARDENRVVEIERGHPRQDLASGDAAMAAAKAREVEAGAWVEALSADPAAAMHG